MKAGESEVSKVVLDTNIFISSIFWRGNPHIIVRMAGKGQCTVYISKEIYAEIRKVLARDFDLDKNAIDFLINSINLFTHLIDPVEKLNVLTYSPDDNKILECAVACKADFIITGDNHLLKLREFRKIKIISPKEFLMLQH
jgi:putative PIN family toxin of toxin-antitoxin system